MAEDEACDEAQQRQEEGKDCVPLAAGVVDGGIQDALANGDGILRLLAQLLLQTLLVKQV